MRLVDVLQELRDGKLLDDLGAQLGELLLRAQETGKSGTLTLTLEIKPSGSDRVLISEKTNLKVPTAVSLPATFFLTDEGELSRKNPHQTSMGY